MEESTDTMEYEYVINTLDATYGVIGGFMAMLWAISGSFVADGNNFQKEEEIIQEFYTTDKALADKDAQKRAGIYNYNSNPMVN